MSGNDNIAALVKSMSAPPKEPSYAAEVEELVRMHSAGKKKMRREPEILARFKVGCTKYKQLKNSRENVREQQVMLYSELKVLGWVLGMNEQQVVMAINS